MLPTRFSSIGPYAIPSDRAWFDPMLIQTNVAFSYASFDLDGSNVLRLAQSDPTRVALGFVTPSVGTNQASVGPWSDVSAAGGFLLTSSTPLWFSLFVHASLVNQAWYGFSSAPQSLRVIYLTRLGG